MVLKGFDSSHIKSQQYNIGEKPTIMYMCAWSSHIAAASLLYTATQIDMWGHESK